MRPQLAIYDTTLRDGCQGAGISLSLGDKLAVARRLDGAEIGIHAHNDGELAVANSLAAVDAGARQVQGTINGYGERSATRTSARSCPTSSSSRATRARRRGTSRT